MSKLVKRLFKEFQPTSYQLSLHPDRENQRFAGTVVMTGKKTHRPNKRLTFHQKDLKITSAAIVKHDKKEIKHIEVVRINTHNSFDEVRLHTRETLYPGTYEVTIRFEGKITAQMNGMYPCNFEHGGKKKQLIATQFESHYAREVFPCVDEPEAKATFDLTITTPVDETVIANTPVKKRTAQDNLATTVFETTPIMSTYLLAFVYGEMGFKEAKTSSGVTVRAYATPDNVQFTDFALDVAVKCLDFYNDYFGISYPLEKCDMIALPDFASGAMENWGCITYREQCMLVDPKNTSVPTKQYVAMVVAHELAHQWFGNLVTMRWWTDLWLNEGFASWIEYMAVDHIFPEWQMWTQFSVDEQHRAFKLDALEHTHPIEVPINHPDEIHSIFDTISYSKGASVIHMLHAYLGPEHFRDGLRHYLKTHAHGNTDTIDLWQALEDISKKPVRTFMHAWTSQDGFPAVSVQTKLDKTTISQRRFYINPEHKEQKKVTWPISLQTDDSSLPDLLNKSSISVQLENAETVKLNRSQTGFFRVDYDQEQLAYIGEQVKKGDVPVTDRLGVLSDVFESAKAGLTKTSDALAFLGNFVDEDNSAVWDVIAASIGSTRAVMDDEKLRDNMKPYIIKIAAKQYKRLDWTAKKNDSYFDQLLRPTVIGMTVGADEPEAVKKALALFKLAKKPEDIDPELRSIVFSNAVRVHNDQKTFDKLFAMYEQSTMSEEKTTLAAALTGFKATELYKQAFDLITTNSVRHQDISYWLVYSFSNRFARRAAWEWMCEHWEWLEKTIGSDLSFYRFPLYAANSFSDRSFIPEYTTFFTKHKNSALERSINQGLETLTWQSAWKERDQKSIIHFFSNS